jgi:2,3-bisphosphoglycerate-dependent phosphoglycerate mutase
MIENNPIRLFLVRHGNTFEKGETPTQVGAKTDLPLTAQGKEQAKYFAHFLALEKCPIKAIYTGSLKRQIDSAEILANELHLGDQIIHRDLAALTEIDYGLWEGLTSEEILNQWPGEYKSWTTKAEWPKKIFNGSLDNHLKNLALWIKNLRETYSNGDIIVGVTSNGIMRFFYALEMKEEWDRLRDGNQVEDLKVKTGHFCELHLFKDSIKIISWNQNPASYTKNAF